MRSRIYAIPFDADSVFILSNPNNDLTDLSEDYSTITGLTGSAKWYGAILVRAVVCPSAAVCLPA